MLVQVAPRLREIGFHQEFLSSFTAFHSAISPDRHLDTLRWTARESNEPAALAARFFIAGDEIPGNELRTVLGSNVWEALDCAGALVPGTTTPDTWSFAFRIEMMNGVYIASDSLRNHPEAVMGVGGTTRVLAPASYPQRRIESALDLGCGSGALALMLAGDCDHVVATDINPRAVALAKFNAAINGFTNIDCRTGSDYDPVGDRRFDLIVCQPPFCPDSGPEQGTITYLHGGARGDEIALRLLAGVPDHLTPTGRAVFLTEFPVLPSSPVPERLRAAIPRGDILLAVQQNSGDLRVFATFYAPALDADDIAGQALSLYRHFRRQGTTSIWQTVVMVAGGEGQFIQVVKVPGAMWDKLHRSHLDRAMSLWRRPLGDFAAMRVRLSAGSVALMEQSDPLEPDFPAPSTDIQPKGGSWLGPLTVSSSGYLLLRAVCRAESVAEGVASFTEGLAEAEKAEALEQTLPFVREAMVRGVLMEQ